MATIICIIITFWDTLGKNPVKLITNIDTTNVKNMHLQLMLVSDYTSSFVGATACQSLRWHKAMWVLE